MTIKDRGEPGRINRVLAAALVAGVWIAAGLIMTGLALWLARSGTKPSVKEFGGVAPGLDAPTGVLVSAWKLEPAGIMALGVLVLIATPVARVAFAVIAFVLERDRLYAAVSAVVLGLLACGLVFGMVG
jgi:uncharacterized membrane protein